MLTKKWNIIQIENTRNPKKIRNSKKISKSGKIRKKTDNPEKIRNPEEIRKNFQNPVFFRKIRKIWQL